MIDGVHHSTSSEGVKAVPQRAGPRCDYQKPWIAFENVDLDLVGVGGAQASAS